MFHGLFGCSVNLKLISSQRLEHLTDFISTSIAENYIVFANSIHPEMNKICFLSKCMEANDECKENLIH